jgi:CRP-like cAMP-binding protein
LADHRPFEAAADHQLIVQGDWSDSVYLLQNGLAKVRRFQFSGQEVTVALLGPGDLFGELAMLFRQDQRTADVVALVPSAGLKLRRSTFEGLLRTSPELACALAAHLGRRLADQGLRLGLTQEGATTRVLAALMELARSASPDHDPLAVIPPLPQREIAILAGLARGTTCSILSRLRVKGLVLEDKEGLRIASLDPLQARGLLS